MTFFFFLPPEKNIVRIVITDRNISYHPSLLIRKASRELIQGIGVDIVAIDRIRQSIDRFGMTFLRKVFTENEIRSCQSCSEPEREFAFYFSAKEALSKALATGYSGDFRWHNIEIVSDATGRHSFLFHHATAERLQDHAVHLSLSCTGEMTVAFVIIHGHRHLD